MSAPTGLQFEFVSGCLVVRATGSAQFEQLLNLRETTGPSNFMERYELGELAARYLPKIPIAVLMREDQTDRELIGRQVARNRGADLEVFLEPAEADAWLKQHAVPAA